jgi:hypothetical protein
MNWLNKQCEKSVAIWSLNGAIAAVLIGAGLLGMNFAAALMHLKAGDRLSFFLEFAQVLVFLLWLLFGIAMTHAVVPRLIAQAGREN